MTENCKLRKALFSSFYNISQRNFGILLILWCSFKLWWNFCLDQNFSYKGKGPLYTASGEWLSNVFLALAKFAVRRPKTRWVVVTLTWKHSLSKHAWFGNSAKVFRPYSKNSHSMSGGSIWASLECQCCFWMAEGLVSYTLQVFKNSTDTQEKLRLNLYSLSVSELLEYGRLFYLFVRVYAILCTVHGQWTYCIPV
jgi:hypothetical protein